MSDKDIEAMTWSSTSMCDQRRSAQVRGLAETDRRELGAAHLPETLSSIWRWASRLCWPASLDTPGSRFPELTSGGRQPEASDPAAV